MHSNRSLESQNNEFSITEILNLGLHYKKWILAGGIFAGLLGAVLGWQRPEQWQGSVLLEMGMLDRKLDETMLQALNKVSLPVFKNSVWSKVEIKSDRIDKELSLFQQSLRAENIKGTNLVEIRMSAFSKEVVQALLMEAAKLLQANLDEILLPAIEALRARSQLNLKNIQSIESDIQALRNYFEKGDRPKGSDLYFSNIILNDRIREGRSLEVLKLDMQNQLSPSRTFLTKIVGDVQANRLPGKPSRSLIITMSVLFGCVGTWVLAYIHSFWKKGFK